MLNSNVLAAACAAGLICTLAVCPASGETFTWTGDAGAPGWSVTRPLDPLTPDEYTNNFGRTGNPPLLPGILDDVLVPPAEIAPQILPTDGAVSVGSLEISGELTVAAHATLTTDNNLHNRGTFSVTSDDLPAVATVGGILSNAAGGLISVSNNASLTVNGPTLVNDGAIWLVDRSPVLSLPPGAILAGTGWLYCGGSLDSPQVTNGPDHTIGWGAGRIRAGLVNEGTVDANRPHMPLYLEDLPKTNNSLLKASNGGILRIEADVTQGPVGRVVADGGTVSLAGSIEGGALETVGTGRIAIKHEASPVITSVRNDGRLDVPSLAVLQLQPPGMTNNGTIKLDGRLTLTGDATIDGDGEIRCYGPIGGPGTLRNGPGHTIRGSSTGRDGQLGSELINEGTIDADLPGRMTLGGSDKTNRGLIRASNGGTLEVRCTVRQEGSGRIVADDGMVRLAGPIEGGTLAATEAGIFETTDDMACSLQDLTNEAPVRVLGYGAILTLASGVTGTITNNGSIVAAGNMYQPGGRVQIAGDVELAGHGELRCDGGRIDGPGRLTNGSEHTIRLRSGQVSLNITNNGAITADVPSGIAELQGQTVNNNLIEVAPEARLLLGEVENGPAGRILADGGTVVIEQRVTGGLLTGPGRFETQPDGETIFGDLTNDSHVRVDKHSTLILQGTTLANNGLIQIMPDTGNGFNRMQVDGDIEITGTGRIESRSDVYGGPLTVGAEQTVLFGRGSLNLSVNNAGLLHADLPGLSHLGFCNNSGTIRASNDARLDIDGIVQTPAGRTIADGAVIALWNEVSGGTLQTSSDGWFETMEASDLTMRDLTNEGLIRVPDGSQLRLDGTAIVNNGTIDLLPEANGRGGAGLDIGSELLLNGTGQVVCRGAIFRGPLTNGPHHTIHGGPGHIGCPLVNEGTITADQMGETLRLDGEVTNHGLIRAEHGGTLQIESHVQQEGAGRIVADDSVVILGNATIENGSLESLGGGRFETVAPGEARLQGVVSNARILIDAVDSVLCIDESTFTNNGTIDLGFDAGSYGGLRINGAVLLEGAGEVVCRSRISGRGMLTIGTDQTIRGRSLIDLYSLVNHGVVKAEPGPVNTRIRGTHAGSLTIQADMFENHGLVHVTPEAALVVHGPAGYRQVSGRTLVEGTLSSPDGPITIDGGRLTGSGIVQGSVEVGHADIEPGTSHGMLTIQNGRLLMQENSRLCIDLAGDAPGDADMLIVGGEARLGGELHIRQRGTHVPVAGHVFTILTAASNRLGTFSSVTGSGQYEVIYEPHAVRIRVLTPPLAGDANGDGAVNAIDLLQIARDWGTHIGEPEYNPDSDLNGDGQINAIDLLILAHAWPHNPAG